MESPTSNKNQYEESLNEWFCNEMTANEFVTIISRLFYEKSVELIFHRSQLLDRSASVVLYKHSYAERITGKILEIKDSIELAKAIMKAEIVNSRIDLGRLNFEWTEEKSKFENVDAFVADKLSYLIGKKPTFDKPVDVVLFGFGRIGRLVARELIIQGNGTQLRVRAIVTRNNSGEAIKKRASLFRHDSIHGPFRGVAIENIDDETIFVNGNKIKMIEANAPEDIDYTKYGINDALLIDNTGVYRDKEALGRHLKSKGIAKVLLTAPAKGEVPNIVYGANHLEHNADDYDIWSAASCTTNAAIPALKVMEEKFGIEKGHLETIHAYTNDQNLLDNYHKKYRRGRAAPTNMVITETGAAKAAVKVIPSLEGKLTGNAVRVPVPNVSLVILTLTLERQSSLEEINDIMLEASMKGGLVEQIRYSNAYEAVSSDFVGDSAACIYDSPATQVSKDGRNVVMYLWYDNEFGYTMQVMRLAKHVAKVKTYRYY
ncbi:MAG: glyceraldehyde-3-phosphate dehydrogenase [Bacteroidetes bacterium]|nr:glyceraldehyde-3-phosphate dehydrogenase [Bacteroidota bacterium]